MKSVVKQPNMMASSQYMHNNTFKSLCKKAHSSDSQKAARRLTLRYASKGMCDFSIINRQGKVARIDSK